MIPVKESFRMPQPAVALSNTNMMSPQLFFLSCSPFLFFSSRVACLVVLPIGPFMCLQENFLSSLSPSTCVEQNAGPGNRVVKCADAYIFRRKVSVLCLVHATRSYVTSRTTEFIVLHSFIHLAKESLGCRNLRRHSPLPR